MTSCVGRSRARVTPQRAVYSRRRRHVGGAGQHALALHAQDVDHVGVGDRADVVRDAHARGLDAARDQRRRPDERHVHPHQPEAGDVGARHPGVQHVADDGHVHAVEPAHRLADGVQVEQALGGVLVLAVARVDHVGGRPLRRQLRRADLRVADHDDVGAVGVERADGVLERLALVHAGARALEAHRVGGEPLGGQLERRRGARGALEEDVDDRAPAQRGDLLDLARQHALEALRGVEDALDVVAAEVGHVDQVPLGRGHDPSPLTSTTSSTSSVSSSRTVDALRARRRQVLAHVVGADGQLPVAAVGEHRELHAGRPAVVEDRVDGRADRAAREQHVVHEHDGAALDREVELRGVDHGLRVRRDARRRAPRRRRGRRRCRARRRARRRRWSPRCGAAGAARAARRGCRCRPGRAGRGPAASRRSRSRCARAYGRAARRRGARGRWPCSCLGLLSGLSGHGFKGLAGA